MKVIAAKGTRCPKEGYPREYIADAAAVDVPDTAYYKRLVKDGSLILAHEGTVPDLRAQAVESGLSPENDGREKKGGRK